MTNKNDALFFVKLPFGQKTIPYEDVPELIAMAKSPGYDIEKASGDEDVSFVLSVGLEERPLRAAVHAGEVEVLNKSLHRIDPPFRGRLEDTVLTVRALREYVESIHGNLEVADAPELKATTPSPAPVVSDGDAPAKRSNRKPSWATVAMPYMKSLFTAGHYKSASMFYKALMHRASESDSPFKLFNRELYCTEAGTTVSDGALGNVWPQIRAH